MPLSKNWKAIAISGIAGNEIIVTADAHTGILAVMPELKKRKPQGKDKSILQLNLVNAFSSPGNQFVKVQYNEKIKKQDQYKEVQVFHDNEIIKMIVVNII